MIHREAGRPETSPRQRPLNNRQLADNLCASSAELREARRAHVQSFGALIPHVFMGSVLAYVGRCLRGSRAEPVREVVSIMEALECGMETGDRETRNVIAISFARDAEVEPFFERLRPYMGSKLKVQLQGR